MRLEVVFSAHAARMPDKEAVVCEDRRVRYRDLQARVREVAGGLAKLGVGEGDRVVLYLPNGVEFVELLYAAFTLGAIAVPVTTRLTIRELAYFSEDSAAKVIVCSDAHADGVRNILKSLPDAKGVVIGNPNEGFVSFAEVSDKSFKPKAIDSDNEVAMIMYTSGTTGKPKGVLLTHANILVNHGFMNATDWGIGHRDRYLVASPLAHRAGLGRLMNSMTLGGTIFVLPAFDAEEIAKTIEREKVTVVGMVPTMCRMFLPALEKNPARCETLRRIVVTGEAFPVELKKKLIALLPDTQLVSFFAMTEAGSITNLSHEEQFSHPKSVGRPAPGVEVRIVDENGKDVETGGIGEVIVRSGKPGAFTIMKGYYNRPEETAKSIRDGWFYTGDMAQRDDDGYIYIVDRKKDMILSGGFNIYSKEVEQTILEVEGVADVAVVGVPDEIFGEAVAAFVELDPKKKAPTADDIVAHCREAIASYKKPKYVVFVEAMPRNAVGKILKHELSSRARESTAKDVA
ncbi:MAG: acyl--CoA ligase [Xanthobacteraceae bacterium]|nr:acyl--CoA ligase [Xanthobacteraceae bacterium]QYK46183.1 MAG: acyl--CoA ligase [Xanthobacteraceae bacterium]